MQTVMVDSDQILRSAASDLGLHCLPITLLFFDGGGGVWGGGGRGFPTKMGLIPCSVYLV